MIPNYEVRSSNKLFRNHIDRDVFLGGEDNYTKSGDTIPLNAEKFQRYMTYTTSIRVRNKTATSEDFYINVPMVNCKPEWFKDVLKKPSNIEMRLCPNLDRIKSLPKKFWQLYGSYDS